MDVFASSTSNTAKSELSTTPPHNHLAALLFQFLIDTRHTPVPLVPSQVNRTPQLTCTPSQSMTRGLIVTENARITLMQPVPFSSASCTPQCVANAVRCTCHVPHPTSLHLIISTHQFSSHPPGSFLTRHPSRKLGR